MEKEATRLLEYLERNDVPYTTTEHAPVFTSQQAAATRGVPLKSGVKAIVFKARDAFILALVPADKRIDIKKLALAAATKVRLASPEEVLKATACEIGSVHPFGNLFEMKVYADPRLIDNDMVNFNAGMHTLSVQMNSVDLIRLICPIVADIVE